MKTIAFNPEDSDGIISTCMREAENQGLHAIVLCPAVSNELVAKLSEILGESVAIFTGRGDFRSFHLASVYTQKEWH